MGTVSTAFRGMSGHDRKCAILIYHFWGSVLRLLTFYLFSLGIGFWAFSVQLKAVPPRKGAESLKLKECKQLYRHQLRLARKDDIPLAFTLGLNLKHLQNKDTQSKQAYHCQQNTNRVQYDCQMRAKSFLSLMACTSKKEQDQGVRSSSQGISELKVNKTHCLGSYEYILKLVKQSKDFQKSSDQKELESHWQSPAAHKSFQRRCLKHFRKEDLKCIQDAQDMDILSGCLLAIPE